MADTEQSFDQLITSGLRASLDRVRNSLTILLRGQPLVQGATAEVSYRLRGENRRLSLLGPDSTCTVNEAGINLSRANADIELDWHVVAGPRVEASPLEKCSEPRPRGGFCSSTPPATPPGTGAGSVFKDFPRGLEMWLEVSNVGSEPLQMDELAVLTVAVSEGGAVALHPPTSNWRFYQNGWQSWSPAFARRVDDGIYQIGRAHV